MSIKITSAFVLAAFVLPAFSAPQPPFGFTCPPCPTLPSSDAFLSIESTDIFPSVSFPSSDDFSSASSSSEFELSASASASETLAPIIAERKYNPDIYDQLVSFLSEHSISFPHSYTFPHPHPHPTHSSHSDATDSATDSSSFFYPSDLPTADFPPPFFSESESSSGTETSEMSESASATFTPLKRNIIPHIESLLSALSFTHDASESFSFPTELPTDFTESFSFPTSLPSDGSESATFTSDEGFVIPHIESLLSALSFTHDGSESFSLPTESFTFPTEFPEDFSFSLPTDVPTDFTESFSLPTGFPSDISETESLSFPTALPPDSSDDASFSIFFTESDSLTFSIELDGFDKRTFGHDGHGHEGHGDDEGLRAELERLFCHCLGSQY